MKLYELPQAYAALYSRLTDGELDPTLEKELDQLDATLQGKTDNICRLVQQLTREAEAADAEANRLKMLAQVRDNATVRLKRYLQDVLERIGTDKVETDLFKVRLQKSPPSVDWRGQGIPEAFKRTIEELDKKAVIEAWKEGKMLPEGMTIKQSRHLRIQ